MSNITLHKPEDFASMHKAGQASATILDELYDIVQEGITTNQINEYVHKRTLELGGTPAPLNYRGFPKSVCTSINHVVCHGIPNDRRLKKGDIINIDVTTIIDGWYGDTSRMYFVGKPSVRAKRLVEITYDATMLGIEQVRPGATTGDIGYAIQNYVESQNLSVVRDYCGHGLGKVFHTAPNILHYGRKGEGVVLEEGMFFTIEPMVNVGHFATKTLADGWTVVTRDKSLSAQFEHSLGVTANGFEIFTTSPSQKHHP